MAVTIIDVAKRAGVSKTTVSAVLCGKSGIKKETRDRVMEAIDELHYVPNFNARNFVRRRTNILGALVLTANAGLPNYEFDRETGIYSKNVIDGIIERLAGTGYGLITEPYDPKSGKLPQMVRDSRIDGLFVIGSIRGNIDFADMFGERQIPLVLLGTIDPEYDSFRVDISRSVCIAVRRLIETGHRRVGLVNCSTQFSSSTERLAGYEKAVTEAGLAPDSRYVVYSESNTGLAGMHAAEELFARVRPDALVCANVSTTMGVMRYLYREKLRVPDDISVIGHEDSVVYGYASPALTAVNIRKEEMGARGADVMLRRIAGDTEDFPLNCYMEPYLVERESVANAAKQKTL